MKNVFIYAILLFLSTVACTNGSDKNEKFQKNHDDVIDIQETIADIKTNLTFSDAISLSVIDNYLLVTDLKSIDKGIYLFNKKNLTYITDGGIIGRGPGEITRIGNLGIDAKNKFLWVPDFGKNVRWKFSLDSILNNKMYKPASVNKKTIDNNLFLTGKFDVLDDDTAIGIGLKPLSQSTFIKTTIKLNLESNKIETFGYTHPDIVGKRSRFSLGVSSKNKLYVIGYLYDDLLTICDLDGNLKFNIYGPEWSNNKRGELSFFHSIDFYKDNILAAYNGGDDVVYDEFKRPRGNNPSKIIVFDINGDYKKTIEIGYKFYDFCVDEENGRIILYFEDRENPLGYFNINLD